MMKIINYIFFMFFSLHSLAGVCVIESDGIPEGEKKPSMIEIIANGKKFNNSHVSLIGVLHVDSQGRFYLYKDKNSVEYMIFSDSIFLGLEQKQNNKYGVQLNKLSGKYINVAGEFYSEAGKDAGYLSNINFICKAQTLSQMYKNTPNE